jgi:hypothetical protein
MLLLVPLESYNYSNPFLLKAFLKISSFSCRISDVMIFGHENGNIFKHALSKKGLG